MINKIYTQYYSTNRHFEFIQTFIIQWLSCIKLKLWMSKTLLRFSIPVRYFWIYWDLMNTLNTTQLFNNLGYTLLKLVCVTSILHIIEHEPKYNILWYNKFYFHFFFPVTLFFSRRSSFKYVMFMWILSLDNFCLNF